MHPGLNLNLIEKYRSRYTYFWSGPFSNWHPCSFEAETSFFNPRGDQFEYNCSEQYMMLQKAILFNDFSRAEEIVNSKDPKEQKSLGRKVRGFNPHSWEEMSKMVVYRGCYCKFSQNPELKEMLLKTEDTLLVEASPYDCVWGIGLDETNPDRLNPDLWRGENRLGEILTCLRENLICDRSYLNPYSPSEL